MPLRSALRSSRPSCEKWRLNRASSCGSTGAARTPRSVSHRRTVASEAPDWQRSPPCVQRRHPTSRGRAPISRSIRGPQRVEVVLQRGTSAAHRPHRAWDPPRPSEAGRTDASGRRPAVEGFLCHWETREAVGPTPAGPRRVGRGQTTRWQSRCAAPSPFSPVERWRTARRATATAQRSPPPVGSSPAPWITQPTPGVVLPICRAGGWVRSDGVSRGALPATAPSRRPSHRLASSAGKVPSPDTPGRSPPDPGRRQG